MTVSDQLRHVRQRPSGAIFRTCVGCRRRDDRSALLRVVACMVAGGPITLVPDTRRRIPGRGAWLHLTPECFDLAVRRHTLGRALRVEAGFDVGPLRQWFEERTMRLPNKQSHD